MEAPEAGIAPSAMKDGPELEATGDTESPKESSSNNNDLSTEMEAAATADGEEKKIAEANGEDAGAEKAPEPKPEESKKVEAPVDTHYTRSKDPKIKAKKEALMKQKKVKKAKRRRAPKIFLDSISVVIPLDVTADLRIAIQKTRAKRIKSIYKHFPALKKEQQKLAEEKKDEPMLDDDDDENKDGKQPPKKKKKLENVPQPEQYGSVLDYLEAKYVKGVQLGDMEDDDGNSMDDKSEGQGSVYSGGSFLDDTDLQRDVAEQVMANTTLTKLELEEDDADFFVNVGNLEVEDDQYGDNYDPLQDKENQTKKRKKSQASATPKGTPGKKAKKKDALLDSGKSKKSIASSASTKKKKSLDSSAKGVAKAEAEAKKPLIQKARKAKARCDGFFKKLVKLIKAMGDDDLPRRRTKLKVALTCPPSKKPGDDITFANPHNPGQRLRVKVPKDCYPGGTFKVSVPVKAPSADADDGTDHNKFTREFQEMVDDYARAFDDWCSAQSEVDKKFAVYREKQQKFDPLVKEFPKNLLTPVDKEYMKKLVRRARQNKHKRIKTAALKQQENDSVKQESSDDDEEEVSESTTSIMIPTMGTQFPTMQFDPTQFGIEADGTGSMPKSPSATSAKKPAETASMSPSPKRVVNIPSPGRKFAKRKWNEKDFAVVGDNK